LKNALQRFAISTNTITFAVRKLKGLEIMKKDIHPTDYRLVVFQDMSNGYSFITKSTAKTKETIKWEDGNEYPLIKLEISHMSHPFYTGKMKLVDTAGRVDKFKNRYKKHFDKKEAK
jgi:large subunit ribosomal protein L31